MTDFNIGDVVGFCTNPDRLMTIVSFENRCGRPAAWVKPAPGNDELIAVAIPGGMSLTNKGAIHVPLGALLAV